MKKLLSILFSCLLLNSAFADDIFVPPTSVGTALPGQVPATATNDNASSTSVGYYLESVVTSASPISIVASTAKSITSISLPAGDWDVTGVTSFTPANTTSVTILLGCISLVDNTLDLTPGRVSSPPMGTVVYDGSTRTHLPISTIRLSLSTTTSVYLIAYSTFTVSTNTAFGTIRARRVR